MSCRNEVSARMPEAPPFPIRSGNLSVDLASRPNEIDALQALRYRVFFSEMGAASSIAATARQRDVDRFDGAADHLIVVDHESQDMTKIIATCRLLRCSAAASIGGFYSAGEYDIRCLHGYPGRILELGRSCVDAAYRHRSAMQLLWRGIAAYIAYHEVDLIFGCASLPGLDPTQLSPQLSYLYHHHLAPLHLRPSGLTHRHIEMRLMDLRSLNIQLALAQMPPLIKGYLRLGGYVGDGAVMDTEFNTTDVVIIVKTDLVAKKYHKHYEPKGDLKKNS